jgi:homoserine dehydrogenase
MKYKILVFGLGTVGSTVLRLIEQKKQEYANKLSTEIEVVGIYARDKTKQRGFNTANYRWLDENNLTQEIAKADAVLELIGGSDGIAKEIAQITLSMSGKALITANKALLAKHGGKLRGLAVANNSCLYYEAAVAGAIPVIKTLREAMRANTISSVYGILNGTCNFILTQIRDAGLSFADALAIAQQNGYAEADPTFDIEGMDAHHKACIIASLAYDQTVDLAQATPFCSGITQITRADFLQALKMGYDIKLLGYTATLDSKYIITTALMLLPQSSVLATVNGVDNAVVVNGDCCGEVSLRGAGAGGKATASSVLADLFDAVNTSSSAPSLIGQQQKQMISLYDTKHRYYIRFDIADTLGNLSAITNVFSKHGVSFITVKQELNEQTKQATIFIETHACLRSDIERAFISSGELIIDKPICLIVANFL